MLGFLFGRRRKRTVKRKGSKKPPARLIKMCKRYRIKCTKKVGKRRVYKKVSVLKKQLKRKMGKVRRTRFGLIIGPGGEIRATRPSSSNSYAGSLRNYAIRTSADEQRHQIARRSSGYVPSHLRRTIGVGRQA
jgi:hypothetical protein